MNLLLDTHVFLWWDAGTAQLGKEARAAIANPENSVFVSAASIWVRLNKRRKSPIGLRFLALAVLALPRAIDGLVMTPVWPWLSSGRAF